jgi:hypothetical protein
MHKSAVRILILTTLAVAGCRCSDEPKRSPDASPADAPAPLAMSFVSVWGSSAKDVWAVGPKGAIGHFDGRSWAMSPSVTTKNLSAVSGSAADDVWAVGEQGTTLHFDGTVWSVADQDDDLNLLGVWAGSKGEAWASGIADNVGLLRHYNGKKWENLFISGANSLWKAWGSGPKDIWLVGSDKHGAGFVLHGDGAKFDRMPFEGGSLRGVWGSAPDDVWVSSYDGQLTHWDGSAWSAAAGLPAGRFLGGWGTTAKDMWSVGFDGAILHYDGHAWVHSPATNAQILWSVWGSAADDVWIVGNGGTILHWQGRAWAPHAAQ